MQEVRGGAASTKEKGMNAWKMDDGEAPVVKETGKQHCHPLVVGRHRLSKAS
jgi:hypothetical protein